MKPGGDRTASSFILPPSSFARPLTPTLSRSTGRGGRTRTALDQPCGQYCFDPQTCRGLYSTAHVNASQRRGHERCPAARGTGGSHLFHHNRRPRRRQHPLDRRRTRPDVGQPRQLDGGRPRRRHRGAVRGAGRDGDFCGPRRRYAPRRVDPARSGHRQLPPIHQRHALHAAHRMGFHGGGGGQAHLRRAGPPPQHQRRRFRLHCREHGRRCRR